MSNNGLISGSFSSDTTLSTPVAINKGGTGQTTAQAALDALAAASGNLVQGDIFIVDSSGNVVRLARGADDTALVMNGNNPNWEAASGGLTINTQSDYLTSSFSTTSASYVSTGLSLTLSDQDSGNANIVASGQWRNLTGSVDAHGTLTDDGTRINDSSRIAQMQAAIAPEGFCSATNMTTDGSVIEFEIHNGGGGTAYMSASATYVCALIILELY